MATYSTLEKIQKEGFLSVGFQRHTPPFSYCKESEFQPIGYSVELFRQIMVGLEKTLGVRDVKVKPVEVTSATRLGMLQRGSIDIECGSTSITPERKQFSLFSQPIFLTTHKLLLKPGVDLQLVGSNGPLKVVGIQSSTSHAAFVKWQEHFPHFQFSGRKDIASSFDSFQDDEGVVGMVADEVILRSLMLQAGIPETNLHTVQESTEAYGFMIRLDDLAFLRQIDVELAKLRSTGSWRDLHENWFVGPMSGIEFNQNLGLELKT